jgi:transposase
VAALRSGRPPAVAAELAGVGKRTVERWLSWYRRGGLEEVLKRVPGHGAPGSTCWLGGQQLEELVARAGEGAVSYLRRSPGLGGGRVVSYEYKGMYGVLARLSVRPKVPRPAAQKANPDAQEAWKKGDSR